MDTLEQAQWDHPATLVPIDTTPSNSAPGTSRAPSSSRSTPPSTALVPIGWVHKLDAQIATLLHHIQLWMQKSIVEAEDQIEKKVAQ